MTRQDITQLDPAVLLPRPSAEVTDTWPMTRAQQTIDEDLTLMVNLVCRYQRSGIDDTEETYAHTMHCDERAAFFYNTGQYYQAQAYEWAATVGMHTIDYIREEDPQNKQQLLTDARTVSRGSALLDHLPTAGYDPEAAAVLTELT